MTTITGLDELRAVMGTEFGVTDWHEVTQAEVDAFADATGDHQWIHVDPERAAQSPLGGTIAHGLFTLSLAPAMTSKLLSFEGFAFALNYGYNRVRFPAPLPVGSRVRMRATLAAVEDIPGGAQITIVQTFEREGEDKPVCVAESLARVYAAPSAGPGVASRSRRRPGR
jgi:acyl dehydratase